jgi:uncharacterized protein
MKAKILIVGLLFVLAGKSNLLAQSITSHKVTFDNHGLKMAGNLFLPNGFDETKKYPSIITVHPGGGVKEQTSGLYAQKLAEKGYITLAFDASHQGESEGLPRLLEDPSQRVEDIRSAVDYLTTLSYVDGNRIGLIGICAGGGYSISAAQTDHRIKVIAVASPVDIGLTNRKGWDGNSPVTSQLALLETIAKTRTDEANGAKSVFINYVPEVVDENTIPDMKEAHDYYRTPRAQHPNSTNQFLLTSLDKILAFDAFNQISTLLTQPLLVVVGTNAGSKWQGELAHKMAKSKKELVLIDGATHMDLYDIPKYVSQVVTEMNDFFGKNL